jgi:hypothetical protein
MGEGDIKILKLAPKVSPADTVGIIIQPYAPQPPLSVLESGCLAG